MDAPAMVVLAYNRPQLLEKTLESLSATKGISRFKLYVSQHGNKSDVEQVIRNHPAFTRLHLERRNGRLLATVHIAQHYK
jgi:GT2 family glycosyltransferase